MLAHERIELLFRRRVDLFEREDVDPQSDGVVFADERFVRFGGGVDQLEELIDRTFVAMRQKPVGAFDSVLEQVIEFLVVVARHEDVDIVVPGYEAFVAQRAEAGAVGEQIGQVVLGADAVELEEDIQFDRFDFVRG